MPMLPRLTALMLALTLLACGKGQDQKPSGPPPTLITQHQVTVAPLDIVEETTGALEALVDPKIAAEVTARVTHMLARPGQSVKAGQTLAILDPTDANLGHRADNAELQRLEALLRQQEKLAERQAQLMERGFISKNAGEDIAAQRDALRAQLDAARARQGLSARMVEKTRIAAPANGIVDMKIASVGDYLRPGDPIYTLVANGKLRAHLPFSENALSRIKPGAAARLTSPLAPGRVFETRISDIRPVIAEGARTLEALVDIENDGTLRGGGSVDAQILIEHKTNAIAVPEQSVVLRPAGRVVYLVANNQARQQVVQIGAKQNGRIEIVSGLKGGEIIALDGAGFLTDGAPVALKPAEKSAR